MITYDKTITVKQKNPYSCKLTYKFDGSVVDLSNFNFNFIVKNKEDCLNNDSQALIDKTIILTNDDAVNGIFYLNLDGNDTNIEETIIGENEYVGQFQLEKDGILNTIIQVNFVVKNNIRKD